MYILKNAYLSIVRGKGRNILIGIIITAITISSCVALTINKSGKTLIESYKEKNPIEVTFKLDPMSLRNASDEDKEAFQTLDIEKINNYGDSKYISDYYYTSEVSLSSSSIEPVDYSTLDVPEPEGDMPNDMGDKSGKMEKPDTGDFRLTGYSNVSYIDTFISGTMKLKEGEFFTKDVTDKVIVISEELATQNSLSVGDTVTFYSSSDEDTTYEFKIVGIFEDSSDVSSDNFMNMNAMNSRNQIFTPINNVQEILSNTETDTSSKRMMSVGGLTAKFYLENNDDLEKFEAEVREKGLSTYYSLETNEEEALASLKPIQNLSNFSFSFLIIILIVGAIVLGIINMINIRERKYEIGVLRAIGMSKSKVTLQLITEIFLVSIASLIIGTLVGTVLSQPVTNMMLKNEIESFKEEQTSIQNNFGPGNFERPGFGGNEQFDKISNNTNYVDTLNVSVDVVTVIQLFFVSLLLTVISGVISVTFVNKYNPNKILQNRA